MASFGLAYDIVARDRASRTMDKVAATSEKTGGRLTGAFGLASKAMGGMALAAGGAAAAGLLVGVKTAASMEQAKISFTTMLGSAQKADVFLRDLGKFAAATPFEFPELQTAASSLISAGIQADKVIPIMTTLGDVTSGMGTGADGVQRATVALQQMSAAGKITGEDLNQLRDAGIPVYDLLSKATGKSKAEVVKLAQAGKLGSKELGQMMKALETGKGLERFSGLMKKQSSSLSGLWSTFKDTLNMGLANLLTPAIPALKATLGLVSTLMGNAFSNISKFFTAIHNGFSGDVSSDKGLMHSVAMLGDRIGALWVKSKPALARLGQAFVQVAGWVKVNVLPVLMRLGGWVVDKLLPAFVHAYAQVLPKVRGAFKSIGKTIAEHRPMFEKIGGIFKALGVVLTNVVIPVLGKVAGAIYDSVGPAFSAIVTVLDKVVVPTIRFMAKVWLATVGGLVNGAAKAFGWVKGIGGPLKDAAASFNSFSTNITNALDGVASGSSESGQAILDGARKGMAKAAPKAQEQATKTGKSLGDAVQSGAKSTVAASKYAGKMIVDGIKVGIQVSGAKAKDAAEKVMASVRAAVEKAIGPLNNAIQASRARLAALKDSSKQLRETARDNAKSFASILGFSPEEGKPTSAGDVLASMRERLAKVVKFKNDLAGLLKKGLNTDTYRQILEGGVDQGGGIAAALLAGGSGAVGQANQLQGQLNTASSALGTAGATALYGSQIQSESDRLAGLVKEKQALTKTEISIKIDSGVAGDPTKTALAIQKMLLSLQRQTGVSLGFR